MCTITNILIIWNINPWFDFLSDFGDLVLELQFAPTAPSRRMIASTDMCTHSARYVGNIEEGLGVA